MTDPYCDCLCRFLTFTGKTFSEALENLVLYVKENNNYMPVHSGAIEYSMDEEGDWCLSLIYDYTHDTKWDEIVKKP